MFHLNLGKFEEKVQKKENERQMWKERESEGKKRFKLNKFLLHVSQDLFILISIHASQYLFLI